MSCLLPTYWTVLPLIYFAYIKHAIKHKKSQLINITVYLEIPQKPKKKLNWSNKTWGIQESFWTWFSRFLFPDLILCHNTAVTFCQFCTIFHWPCGLLIEYFKSHSFTVSIMGVIASLVFLILSWFPQYFFHVLNETLSLLRSFYLSPTISFKGCSPPLPL